MPDIPNFVLPQHVLPVEINLPPIMLCTYGLDCKLCGGIVHGSYCASSQEDLTQHIAEHPKICHFCLTEKKNS